MDDIHYMKQAVLQAQKAFDEDEVPVGAIIVMNDKIIALTSAFNFLGSKYLPDATIYISVEPCLMCAGALYWSKIGRVVYGASDEKNGYLRCTKDCSPFHPKTQLTTGILKDESAVLMKSFFKQKR